MSSPPNSGSVAGTPAPLKSNAGASLKRVIPAFALTFGSLADFAAASSSAAAATWSRDACSAWSLSSATYQAAASDSAFAGAAASSRDVTKARVSPLSN